MPTNWRTLFDTIGVTWVDTDTNPRNTSRGWVSIACPWCGDDPSQHLGINEEFGHYRCLRNEDHRGRSPYWLLKGLGVSPRDMDDLLNSHGRSSATLGAIPLSAKRSDRPEGRVVADSPFPYRWKQLTPAGDNPRALNYLAHRNFPDPERTCREFDLRIGTGKWSRRIWFGLRDLAGTVSGMTGRTWDRYRQPRYYTEAPRPMLYLPRSPNRDHRLALLVEGPMDALRTADVTGRRRNLLVIALCGLSATGHRRLQLTELAKRVPSFAIALDSSVESVQREKLMNELRAVPALGKITRLKVPEDKDDPGEMTNSEVERWLSTL
jgi:hypothetical protein